MTGVQHGGRFRSGQEALAAEIPHELRTLSFVRIKVDEGCGIGVETDQISRL